LQIQAERIGYREALSATQAVTYTLAQLDSNGNVLASNDITLNAY